MLDNTASHTLTPADVAPLLGVNAHTVRRWAAAHGPHLSASATPAKDAPRRFTPRDVEVLRTVATLRGQGLHTEAINAQLAALTFAEVDSGPAQAPTEAPIEGQGVFLAPALLDSLTARLQASEKAAQDRVWVFIVGFVAGLAAMGALVGFMLALSALAG